MDLYSFTFRGLLTEEALDKSGRKSPMFLSTSLDEDTLRRLPFDLIDGDALDQARVMSTVFTILCAFENSVRLFITGRLLEEFKEEWWEKGISQKIRDNANKRMQAEEKTKWHSQRGEDPINYIDFGDLQRIIMQNFTLFEDLVDSEDWIKSVLKPLELSRNVLMHSGTLSKIDIERIGSLIRDWCMQVG